VQPVSAGSVGAIPLGPEQEGFGPLFFAL